MAAKFTAPGDAVIWTNNTGGTKVSGSIVVIAGVGAGAARAWIGVTLVTIANLASGAVAIIGLFKDVPKVSGAVFNQGEPLLWDASAGAFDDFTATPAAGDVGLSAVAAKAGINGETVCEIHLNARVGTVT